MSESIYGLKRSHRCAELSEANIGEKVTVMGWAQRARDLGGVIFVDLRDRSGILQVVFRVDEDAEIFKKAEAIRSEYVLAVIGDVVRRDDETINDKIPTGTIEVVARELRILSKSEVLPFQIEEDSDVNEMTRLKYRFLDLRRPDMQECLMMRNKVSKLARDYYETQGFLDIETPILQKSTPEGARDYLVPSRVYPGKYFALPQSPQLFKQLLMVSGCDRYFQIARCFRDEDLRADRQPEFTQIDLEMSFVNVDDVIEVNEGLIKKIFKEAIDVDVQLPIKRMTYQEAMDRFGSDKPDIRFGVELIDLSDIVKECGFGVFEGAIKNGGSVRAINAKKGNEFFSRRDIDSLGEFVKIYGAKGMAYIQVGENMELKSPIIKFMTEEKVQEILKAVDAEPGDLICFSADKNDIVYDTLGNLRLEIGRRMGLIDEDKFEFVWVTEFPLLEYNKEAKRYVAKHHPFTSPMDEDIELLDTAPEKVRAKAYDIVLNGCEIGGGSIRIHSQEMQTKMFDLIGLDPDDAKERFGFLLEAFKYGVPPHGGLAFGLDRLVMLMLKKDSIRDVIAFPKVKDSSCPLTSAPDFVEPGQLKDLCITNVGINK